MDFSDRLDPAKYSDDETVGIAAAPRDVPDEDVSDSQWVHISERLFGRLLALGQAYSLHYISVLDPWDETHFNGTQCQGFLEELRFLVRIVSDPALNEALESLIGKTDDVIHHDGLSLRFCPP